MISRRNERLGTLAAIAAAALVAALAALAVLAPASSAAPSCEVSGSETVCTFAYTGAAQDWEVPAGVTSATFDVYGAQGGNAETGGVGGKGGQATATLSVTPGTKYQITVGGRGGHSSSGGSLSTGPGFNGGASDVRTGTELAKRIIVAGGGGGGGSYYKVGTDGLNTPVGSPRPACPGPR